MAKKLVEAVGGGGGVDEGTPSAVSYSVIGGGCFLPTGEHLGVGVVFDPAANGMSEIQISELVRCRNIGLLDKTTKVLNTAEMVTKNADVSGGNPPGC
jgi:hypothetical protein